MQKGQGQQGKQPSGAAQNMQQMYAQMTPQQQLQMQARQQVMGQAQARTQQAGPGLQGQSNQQQLLMQTQAQVAQQQKMAAVRKSAPQGTVLPPQQAALAMQAGQQQFAAAGITGSGAHATATGEGLVSAAPQQQQPMAPNTSVPQQLLQPQQAASAAAKAQLAQTPQTAAVQAQHTAQQVQQLKQQQMGAPMARGPAASGVASTAGMSSAGAGPSGVSGAAAGAGGGRKPSMAAQRAAAAEAAGMTKDDNRLLPKRALQELLKETAPGETWDPVVEDILMDVADDFVDSVTQFACKLAAHRKSDTLEPKDILLHLERQWDIVVPGYSNDELKVYRKPVETEPHKRRLVEVRKSFAAATAAASAAQAQAQAQQAQQAGAGCGAAGGQAAGVGVSAGAAVGAGPSAASGQGADQEGTPAKGKE